MKSFFLSALLGLWAPAALAFDQDSPNLSPQQITDCEGNWLPPGATATTTGTISIRMELKDDVGSVKSGIRVGKTPHDGGNNSRPGTVLLVDFNNDVLDHSTYSNVTTNSGVTFLTDGPAPVSDFLKAGYFSTADGDSVMIDPSPSMNSTTSQMTIQMWINPSMFYANTAMPLFEWNDNSVVDNTKGLHIWMGYPTARALYANLIDINAASHPIFSDPGVITADTWQLITFTYDGRVGQFYKNDVFVSSKDFGPGMPLMQTSYPAYIGKRISGDYDFDGYIDEVRVLNTGIASESQIRVVVANDYHAGQLRYGSGADQQTIYLDYGHYQGGMTQGYLGSATTTVSGLIFPNGLPKPVEFSFQDRGGMTNWTSFSIMSSI